MTPLKKYIRPGVLRNFLRRAFDLTDGQCAFAIAYEGEVAMVEGTSDYSGFEASDPCVLGSHLQFNSIHSGQVRLRILGDCSREQREAYKRQLQFVAFSIQELIDIEHARRSIADEALSKYRELALLHRSVPTINTSLRMRDVVAALINECRRENYPGELGMIFLSEPGSNAFKLAVQFGMPFGSDPNAVARSRLFRKVAQTGKAEIVNDLAGDDRWHNEVSTLGAMVLIPIVSPNRTEGMLVIASENDGVFEAAQIVMLNLTPTHGGGVPKMNVP